MRAGVSSKGNTWVSMGPIGWLIYIVVKLVLVVVVGLVTLIIGGIVVLVRALRGQAAARKQKTRAA